LRPNPTQRNVSRMLGTVQIEGGPYFSILPVMVHELCLGASSTDTSEINKTGDE